MDHRPQNREMPVALSLVVPVFNEADAVGIFIERIFTLFEKSHLKKLDLIFVNDGSTDETLSLLLKYQKLHPEIRIVDLSRNFGKEAALSAGLRVADGEVIVPIDVDLQDPPELIFDMIAEWRAGYEVVLGRRSNRDSDSWAKRNAAKLFYNIYNALADTKLPQNVGDFRLMDRSVVDALNALPETQRFMKGMFAWIGFRTTQVEYVRPKRVAGETKFSGWRLWNFALEGITSFSTDPLRIWTYIGLLVSSLSIIFSIFIALRVMIYGIEVPGYASIIVCITFLGGLQLIGIGVIGEYLGRTYIESKNRPIYIVRRVYDIAEYKNGFERDRYTRPENRKPLVLQLEGQSNEANASGEDAGYGP